MQRGSRTVAGAKIRQIAAETQGRGWLYWARGGVRSKSVGLLFKESLEQDTRGGCVREGDAAEFELMREKIKQTADSEKQKGRVGTVEKISEKQDHNETWRCAPPIKVISTAGGTMTTEIIAGTSWIWG